MLNGLRVASRRRHPARISHLLGAAARRGVVTEGAEGQTEQSTAELSPSERSQKEGLFFVDSVFPVRFGAWDLRHYIGIFRQEDLLGRIDSILRSVTTHGFKLISLDPRSKDGGVFVNFSYDATNGEQALQEILKDIRTQSQARGGFPSWTDMNTGDIWFVQGRPWREDMNRYASNMLKVAFDGPDIREENLYDLLRPFGRILDLQAPQPAPAGTLRSSIVTFRRVRSAATAHNCIHGLAVPPPAAQGATTRLHTMYERPLKAHAIRDWLTSHPRIVMPVLIFFIGTFTYTIFDPIRVFAVEGKMLNWFDYRQYPVYKWLRKNTVERLSFALGKNSGDNISPSEISIWKERQDAEQDVRSYLSDLPSTVTFVHGPQGSGKQRMLAALTKEADRPVLTIDCAELYKASSDGAVLQSLAHQTGYWPVFPFINSLNNLIDIASVGLIGQKAGLSTSLNDQVEQLLEVVGTGLAAVSTRERKREDEQARANELADERHAQEAVRRAELKHETWHDGRLDCVAGNGVMSELGIGDELMRPELDFDVPVASLAAERSAGDAEKVPAVARQKTPTEVQTLKTMPIVIISNFATKRGKDEVITVLSKWAASLVENQVAHVIVVSDNRENAKQLAQALPSKPLHSVALSDADTYSALSFVKQKLREGGASDSLSAEQTVYVEQLGGRASDLETLVHKVHSGQRVEDAVEDIIGRSLNELRKNAFGEDADDAKSLPWTREQAWAVISQLSKSDEVAYHDMLMDFPFKGDETALRNMEHSELVTIGTRDGRPSTVKPGRPVYKYVFQRLVADTVFRATQEIASNEKRIASAESTVRQCEDELLKLREIGTASPHWWSKKTPTATRAAYLLRKMQAAEASIEKLEAANGNLKKVLVANE